MVCCIGSKGGRRTGRSRCISKRTTNVQSISLGNVDVFHNLLITLFSGLGGSGDSDSHKEYFSDRKHAYQVLPRVLCPFFSARRRSCAALYCHIHLSVSILEDDFLKQRDIQLLDWWLIPMQLMQGTGRHLLHCNAPRLLDILSAYQIWYGYRLTGCLVDQNFLH